VSQTDPRTILTTARLTLRELTDVDADALHEILGDPVAMEHYPAPKTRDETLGWIRWARTSYAENGFGLWAVERTSDGAFLGDCGPMLQPVEGASVPEIGYHIVRRDWGHGYATEAAAAVRDLVLGPLGFDRVVSIVDPANVASRRVAGNVHATAREFTWERNGRTMLLFETSAPR
jgi:[ribosomal protein S5]-alanine N-acetyltransferase